MERFASTSGNHVEEDDWGSDFDGEICMQEIEDNKINEIREANLFKNSSNNHQTPTDDSSSTGQTIGRCASAMKTGAIPKSGFSYLNNTNMGTEGSFHAIGISGNAADAQVNTSKSRPVSMSFDADERESKTKVTSNDLEAKKTPGKLKAEAFSFLTKLPQKNVTENGSDAGNERKTLVPTAFLRSENLDVSRTQDKTCIPFNESSNESIKQTPTAPPLENTSSNYESINEESFSEFSLPLLNGESEEESVKPPLPIRPPPVFKYPPETFSSSKSTVEPTCNPTISQPSPINPKLTHSISSPESDSKRGNIVATEDKIMGNKAKNRKSLPSIPAAPRRPLPPLPISSRENVNGIKLQSRTVKLERHDFVSNEQLSGEAATVHENITSQTNQFSKCEAAVIGTEMGERPSEHVEFCEPAIEQSPQQRLAQILTNQTSVDNAVFISHQKIASAITSRAAKFQSSSIPHKTDKSELQDSRQKDFGAISGRLLENDVKQTHEDETEQSSYLEAKETTNPRRLNDHETLIRTMNRPMLPLKAAPIQRSVSCNSLVQSIKDLSFSVWNKPEKKRNSDGINLPKKNSRSKPTTSPPKVNPTAPLHITLVPTHEPDQVKFNHEINKPNDSVEKKTQDYPWFHYVNAKEGQLRLLSIGQDGTFLVRPSSRPTKDIQNTMCIFYNGKVRNLHVCRTADGRYILGTKNSKTFSSVTEIIKYHKENPVEILSQGSTPTKPQVYRILLRETPPKVKKIYPIV